jgi:hypothetical protein
MAGFYEWHDPAVHFPPAFRAYSSTALPDISWISRYSPMSAEAGISFAKQIGEYEPTVLTH